MSGNAKNQPLFDWLREYWGEEGVPIDHPHYAALQAISSTLSSADKNDADVLLLASIRYFGGGGQESRYLGQLLDVSEKQRLGMRKTDGMPGRWQDLWTLTQMVSREGHPCAWRFGYDGGGKSQKFILETEKDAVSMHCGRGTFYAYHNQKRCKEIPCTFAGVADAIRAAREPLFLPDDLVPRRELPASENLNRMPGALLA